MATPPPPDGNERRRWQALCHNYIDLHKNSATMTMVDILRPHWEFAEDKRFFHACAASVYEKHLERLQSGENNLDGVRKAHAIIQEATSRADFDACDIRL